MAKGGFTFKGVAEDESEDENYTVINKGQISNMKSAYFHGDQCFEFTVDGKKYFADINTIQCQGKDLLKTKEGQVITLKNSLTVNFSQHYIYTPNSGNDIGNQTTFHHLF